MEKNIKLNFPDKCGKGYAFGAFTTEISPTKAVEFLKEQGDFLHLNEKCNFRIDDERITDITIIAKDVVVKLTYTFFESPLRQEAAEEDAKALMIQIENLLEYAEKMYKNEVQ